MLLDLSTSMQFHSLGYSKSDYAKTLVATFAYFLSTQRDASGLIIFDEQVESVVPRPVHSWSTQTNPDRTGTTSTGITHQRRVSSETRRRNH